MGCTATAPRILALTHTPSADGCTFARILTPLRALQANEQVEYTQACILPWRATVFQRTLRDLPKWDLIWIARPRHYLMLPIIGEAHHIGTPVLVDVDDWLLDLPAEHHDAGWSATRTSRATMRTALRSADAITASTPVIADYCAALGKQAHEVHVVPNAVDCEQFTRQPREQGPITIVFCGTPSHRDDVPLIALPLRRLLHEQAGRVRVISVGCPISELHGLPGYTHHDSVPATEYPRVLSGLRADIGLAPLQDTPFNRAKSDIKYLEYAATGAVTVASPVVPYTLSVHNDRGLLVSANTADAWSAAIHRLVEDTLLRQHLGTNGYDWVRRERSIQATADKWLEVFRAYADRPATRPQSGSGRLNSGRFAQVLEHIALRQVPYYGREIPHLLAQKARSRHARSTRR